MRLLCRVSVCALLVIAGCLETPIKRIDQDSSMVGGDGGLDAGPDADVPQPCETNEQCKNPLASRCGPKNFCIPCGDDMDCEGIPEGNVCIPEQGCFACSNEDKSACADPTAECHPQTHECVECTAANDSKCGDDEVCDEGSGKCVQCVVNSDCKDPAASVCLDQQCVGCSDETGCSHVDGKNQCNEVERKCVGCTDHSQCTADSPVCDPGTAECAGCKLPADCGNFSDTPVCLTATGACVECTPGTEANDCGPTACDPTSFTCTATTRNSVDTCGECVSDSECKVNHRCIALVHGEENLPQGGHCMKVATSGCSEPYSGIPITRASLSGVPAEPYCGYSEALSSCAAILALESSKACPTGEASECGAVGARCEVVNFTNNRCTYSCASSATCPIDFPCGGAENDKYCGG